MRQDILTGDWITFATKRQNRVMMPGADAYPLAPQTASNPSEVPSMYDVAVFENRSPSFGPALAEAVGGAPAAPNAPRGLDDLAALGLGRTRTSVGRCEVVCFSPEHAGSFGTPSVTRARTVIEAWADRTAALSALPGIEQVFPFENRGEAIGVTLPHPHGQIYAYPYVPPFPQRMLAHVAAHREATGENLFDTQLAAERAGERVVVAGEHWTAFVPQAARWPVEVHLYPHRPTPDLPALDEAQRAEFATLYLDVLRRLDALYDDELPYVAGWNQAPVLESDGRSDARLHLRLHSIRRAPGKIKYLAGSESGAGAFISDVLPEAVAERLRSL